MITHVRTALAAVLLAAGATACTSAQPTGHRSTLSSADAAAPLPATASYVVMTGPSTGWAVWHTGAVWLLLRTTDDFVHVTNRTPVAVPTDGGLVGAFAGNQIGVAVVATERLTRSPVLTGTSATTQWAPQELPHAISDAVGALSVGPGPVSAVTAASDGTLLVRVGGQWLRRTDGRTLAPAGDLRIDAVVWADRRTGWLTGHGAAGVRPVFVTHDSGASWQPVRITSATSVAALAPCGSGSQWVLPVLDADGTMVFLRTEDEGVTWSRGASLQQPHGAPAWGCSGAVVWAAAATPSGDHLEVSADGGQSWAQRASAPDRLTSLVATTSGDGVAATGGDGGRIYAVSDGGRRFTARVMPKWVATLGEQMPGS